MKRWQKNILAFFLSLFIVAGLVGGIYLLCFKAIEILDYKTKKSELERYKIGDGDFYLKNFKISKDKYSIIRDADRNIHVVLKEKEGLYLMDSVKSCDTDDGKSIGIADNKVYIHCLGFYREITEFEIDRASIYKSTRQLNYEKTPNVSGAHLLIEKADSKYLYLYSNVKKDENIEEGNKIKCSLKDNQCEYNIEKKKEEKKEESKEETKEENKDKQ